MVHEHTCTCILTILYAFSEEDILINFTLLFVLSKKNVLLTIVYGQNKKCAIKFCVPQGSIIRPLLLIIFMKDFPSASKPVFTICFY